MKILFISCILSAFIFFNALSNPLNNVLIVSIDALHPEALNSKSIPTIKSLMKEGNYSLNGKSTNPPLTLIAHTAMFTGLDPEESGKTDNRWNPGSPTVTNPTLFDDAKHLGYKTGYFYSKTKLGYLINDAIDKVYVSGEYATDIALKFIKTSGSHYTFVHVSGLDQVGPQYGWLSPEYLEELSYIDEYLQPLVTEVQKQRNYLIILTSDHAGHDHIHGTNHPEDYRLPLVITSDRLETSFISNKPFLIKELRAIVKHLIQNPKNQ